MRHWANRHKLVDTSAKNIEDMRGALQGVVSSVRVAELNANNLCYKEAFTTIIDTSEDWREKLAELLMKQGDTARERGNVEEAAKLFEKAIAARGPELCADVKAGRDRVIEMRRALLRVHGGGEDGDDADMEEAARSKMELADDLKDQGEYEEALKLYDEARDMFVQVRRTLTMLSIICAVVDIAVVLGYHVMCSLSSRFQWQVSVLAQLFNLAPSTNVVVSRYHGTGTW